MVDASELGDQIETRADIGDDDAALFSYWMSQEAIAEKEEEKWVTQGRKIVKRYRDERPEATEGTHQFNILWSNVQTLIPTLYGRTPTPDVERRFKDNDPTGRLASTVMERCLAFAADAFDFDDVMESVVEDRLLPGRGTARVLYVPHFGDVIDEPDQSATSDQDDEADDFEEEDAAPSLVDNEGDEDKEDKADGDQPRQVTYEEAVAVYVFWEDYREGPARTWREVPWARYRSYLTRDELIKRFGKEKGEKINLDFEPPEAHGGDDKDKPPPDIYKKAVVHETWDKTRGEVVWYAPGTPDIILDQRPDPLKLPGFFPGPSPLRSTSTNDKRVPVADYIEYQDQARELDNLTARIDRLTRALKVAGVYAGDEKSTLSQLLDEGMENKLIPVGDSMGWADKGGMKGIIEWFPIEQVAQTLVQLYNARDKTKALLYELTGIGDIMRGMTEPDETAAAQKLKANFSTRRVSPQQRKVAKFARDMLRLMGAVIAEHFSAKTISMISGYPQLDPVPPVPPKPVQPMLPPPMPMAPQPQMNGNGGAPMPVSGAPSAPGPAPIPAGQAPPAPPNGAGPAGPPQPPPNPAMQAYQQQMAQWTQAAQAAAQVTQSNQQKQQEFQAAVDLIKKDGVHGFRIDIEADSTIAIDEAEDQENRTEFMRQFIPLLEQVVPIAQGNPAMSALAKEITLFAVRGFKIARTLEETISNAFDAIAKMPPPQSKGATGADSPADLALRGKQIQADDAKTQAQLTIARERNAVDMAKLGQEGQFKAAELAGDQASDRARHSLEVANSADESSFRRERAGALESREARGLT